MPFYKALKELYNQEKIAKRVYNYETKKVEDKDLAILLRFISKTEQLHSDLLRELLTSAGIEPKPDIQRANDAVKLVSTLLNDKDILRFNQILEAQAVTSYRKYANIAPDEKSKKILLQIADDEKYHENRFSVMLAAIKSREDKEGDPLYVFEKTVDEGKKRLSRSALELLFSGIIGGISVTLGDLASAAASGGIANQQISLIVASVILPLGFFILKLTNTDLFTANFLIPVTPILERDGEISKLLRLWTVTYIGNFLGVAIILALIAIGGIASIGIFAKTHFIELADYKMHRSIIETFISAIFAGMLMTLMTWLVLAVKDRVAKLIAIWIIIFMIGIGSLTHVVLSSAEVFIGAIAGAPFNMIDWVIKLGIPGTIGNIIGGTIFIATLYYLHILHSKRDLTDYRRHKNAVLYEAIKKRIKL